MARSFFPSTLFVIASLVLALILAACGGGADSSATAIPTSTPIPTYGIALPTSMLSIPTSEATVEATAVASSVLDAAVVARGLGRYEALDCASCHGAGGEGTDKGSSLIVSTQTEDEFIGFIRSGGTLGTAHQYPANRLSDSGTKTLYQYLLSLRVSS